MALCTLCNDYPEGTACAMTGCPGRFRKPVNHAANETANCDRIIAAPVGPRALFSDIIEQTALVFGVTVAEIKGKCRKRRIVRPRHVVCYLAKRLIPGISYPVIGKLVGGRDHSTVMNACDKVGIFIDYYPEFAAYVDAAMIRSRADGRAARLRCAVRRIEWEQQPEPTPEPEPIVVTDAEFSDDDMELLSMAVRAHVAAGRDFIEVR